MSVHGRDAKPIILAVALFKFLNQKGDLPGSLK